MTNEELKKKIEGILQEEIEHIADALIAAGIGDVSCLKEHRVIAEYSLVPDDDNPYIIPNVPLRVTQLYSGEEVEKMVKERKELKDELRSKVEYIHEQDEVVKEYKHRAARAEIALDKAVELAYEFRTEADTLSCSSCPMFHIFDSCKERGLYQDCSKQWKEELIKQAEKELAEEEKE